MKQFNRSLGLLITVSILIIGCKGEEGDPAPILTGDITGYVGLFNAATRAMLDKSGVTVRIEGTNASQSATTDTNGRFELIGIPAGTYQMTYEKSGFGIFKQTIVHQGGTIPNFLGSVTLGEKPTAKILNLSLTFPNPSGPLVLLGSYDTPLEGGIRLRVYFSTDPNVSDKNYLSWVSATHTATGTSINGVSFFSFLGSSAYAGATSGTKVYARVCLSNAEAGYIDPDTGITIYPANGPLSETVTYIMP